MLNTITLMGRLTRDPELRYTQNQTPVASFTLAVDRDFSRGEDRQTDFIDIVAWRQTAEFVSKYFSKGSMAVVQGRLQLRDWTDRDGNKRRSAEVVAENVYFGESKRRDGDAPRSDYRPQSSGGSYGKSSGSGYGSAPSSDYGESMPHSGGSSFAELDDDDGELPF